MRLLGNYLIPIGKTYVVMHGSDGDENHARGHDDDAHEQLQQRELGQTDLHLGDLLTRLFVS